MTELAKRLKPTLLTVRHLFAHSGNECAFPGCDHPLIDEHGNFVAEVCHIEAADIGGPRFNGEMTNEVRRHRDNLMLMCRRHHVETDNVHRFPVDEMRNIKAAHEARFSAQASPISDAQLKDALHAVIASAIVDQTKSTVVQFPQTLSRYGKIMAGKGEPFETADELRGDADTLSPMLEQLCRLPVDTRGVLLIVIERGEGYGRGVGLPFDELVHVTGTSASALRSHVELLSRYGIAHMDDEYREHDIRRWVVTSDVNGWRFWDALKPYCALAGLDLEDFVMDMRFDLLD
jgi:hypothetical protein